MTTNLTPSLTDESHASFGGKHSITFTQDLPNLSASRDVSISALGWTSTATVSSDISVDFYANLTLPTTTFDA